MAPAGKATRPPAQTRAIHSPVATLTHSPTARISTLKTIPKIHIQRRDEVIRAVGMASRYWTVIERERFWSQRAATTALFAKSNAASLNQMMGGLVAW